MSRENKESSPFARWLEAAIKRRGWNQTELADASGLRQSTISAWLNSPRTPEKPSFEKVVKALVPEDADEDYANQLYQQGRRAMMGFEADDDLSEHPVYDFLNGQPKPILDRAEKLLKAAFAEEDAIDNAGNFGKKAK